MSMGCPPPHLDNAVKQPLNVPNVTFWISQSRLWIEPNTHGQACYLCSDLCPISGACGLVQRMYDNVCASSHAGQAQMYHVSHHQCI